MDAANFNASQREAVFADIATPMVVVAPPGSGKTHCIIARIRHLISLGFAPHDVLCLTFTNKAAAEMRERLERADASAHGVLLSTFHSFCLRLCRSERFIERNASIWGDAETKKALRMIVASKLKGDNETDGDGAPDQTASIVVKMAALLGSTRVSDLAVGSDERTVMESYARMKREQNAIDFNDMIELAIAKLRTRNPDASPLRRYRAVLVDEFQDTSRTQLELVQLISLHKPVIAVVGDPHQSIYGWRGADFSNWERLQQLLRPRVVVLSTNYRSTAVISAVCQHLIANNPTPKLLNGEAPTVLTVLPDKDPVTVVQCADSDGEAAFVAETAARLSAAHAIPYSDMAILYRSNPRQSTSSVLERQLIRAGIPYQIVAGQALFKYKCIQPLLATLRLLTNPRDEMAFDAAFNYPKARPKAFESAWRAYRGSLSSMEALGRLEQSGLGNDMADHREALIGFSKLLRSWSALMPSTDTTLCAFIRNRVLPDAGYPQDADCKVKYDALCACVPDTIVRGDGGGGEPVTLETQLIAFLEMVALSSASERDKSGGAIGGGLVLSTIHQAKGLEWRVVFVVQCLESVLPSRQSMAKGDDGTATGVEEERRLMFVAMSRAKQFLYLCHPVPPKDGKRSRFVEEVISCGTPKIRSAVRRSNSEFSTARAIVARPKNDLVRLVDWHCGASDENVVAHAAPVETTAVAVAEASPKKARINAMAVLMRSRK